MVDFITSIHALLRWQDLVDIFLVSIILYRILLLFKGTKAVQMSTGLGVILIGYYFAARLDFFTLHMIFSEFFENLFFILIIAFQKEIQNALAHVGKNPFFSTSRTIEEVAIIDEICRAAHMLAGQKVGALIVIERETGLKTYIEAGTPIDSRVNEDLLVSIFHPSSPIHDGAVIIRNSRISSAGCLLPISKEPTIQKELGTRHRAALGLTQETDAVVVVVSEERGEISLVHHGTLIRDLDITGLKNQLLQLLGLRRQEAILQPKVGV